MASPATWRWSWKTTRDSSPTISSSYTPPLVFLSFSLRKTRKLSFSLPPQAFSSLDDNSHTKPSTRNIVIKKKLLLVDMVAVDNPNSIVTKNLEETKGGSSLEGPLWRRIFFVSKKLRGIILLNVLAVIYASNIPVVKEVEGIVDPAAFTVVRFALAAIPFLPFIVRARDNVQTRLAGVELGFWISLGYLMQALGLQTSDAGRASFISLFTVIVVPLLDGALGATVPARTWFGAFMSVLGVALLESSGSPPSVGDFLNFLSAVFFGVHMLRTEHVSRSTKRKDILPLLGYEVIVIAILSAIWYLVGEIFGSAHGWDTGSWTWITVWDWIVEFPWISALYTGLFSTGLCLWVEMSAMRDVSATETAIIYGLEPVWGAGFAWFFLGERWGITGWIGAAFILGGSLTVQILGAASPNDFREDREITEQDDRLVKRNAFSASPVVISAKNVPDLLNKK